MNLMIVPGMLVCSSCVCLLCSYRVRTGGDIWLNPSATVLFISVCSAVIVECCVLYPCCIGVFCMFSVM